MPMTFRVMSVADSESWHTSFAPGEQTEILSSWNFAENVVLTFDFVIIFFVINFLHYSVSWDGVSLVCTLIGKWWYKEVRFLQNHSLIWIFSCHVSTWSSNLIGTMRWMTQRDRTGAEEEFTCWSWDKEPLRIYPLLSTCTSSQGCFSWQPWVQVLLIWQAQLELLILTQYWSGENTKCFSFSSSNLVRGKASALHPLLHQPSVLAAPLVSQRDVFFPTKCCVFPELGKSESGGRAADLWVTWIEGWQMEVLMATQTSLWDPKGHGEGALCALSPENLSKQQEECVQKNAGCRMRGRCEDEELGVWPGAFPSPWGRVWVGRERSGGSGEGTKRDCSHSGMQELGFKQKSISFTEGHLPSLVIWCCAAPTLQGLFPKGRGRELPGSGLQFTVKHPQSVGKSWASLDFIPLSTTASVLEKSQPSFKVFQQWRIPHSCCNALPTIYLPFQQPAAISQPWGTLLVPQEISGPQILRVTCEQPQPPLWNLHTHKPCSVFPASCTFSHYCAFSWSPPQPCSILPTAEPKWQIPNQQQENIATALVLSFRLFKLPSVWCLPLWSSLTGDFLGL